MPTEWSGKYWVVRRSSWSQGSAVSIADRAWGVRPGGRGSIPCKGKVLPFSASFIPVLEPLLNFYSVGARFRGLSSWSGGGDGGEQASLQRVAGPRIRGSIHNLTLRFTPIVLHGRTLCVHYECSCRSKSAVWLDPGSGRVGFVVDIAALGQVFSEYFCFPCQSFHLLHHTHHYPSSGAGTIGQ
jgi:hypothetical protein